MSGNKANNGKKGSSVKKELWVPQEGRNLFSPEELKVRTYPVYSRTLVNI